MTSYVSADIYPKVRLRKLVLLKNNDLIGFYNQKARITFQAFGGGGGSTSIPRRLFTLLFFMHLSSLIYLCKTAFGKQYAGKVEWIYFPPTLHVSLSAHCIKRVQPIPGRLIRVHLAEGVSDPVWGHVKKCGFLKRTLCDY